MIDFCKWKQLRFSQQHKEDKWINLHGKDINNTRGDAGKWWTLVEVFQL